MGYWLLSMHAYTRIKIVIYYGALFLTVLIIANEAELQDATIPDESITGSYIAT